MLGAVYLGGYYWGEAFNGQLEKRDNYQVRKPRLRGVHVGHVSGTDLTVKQPMEGQARVGRVF